MTNWKALTLRLKRDRSPASVLHQQSSSLSAYRSGTRDALIGATGTRAKKRLRHGDGLKSTVQELYQSCSKTASMTCNTYGEFMVYQLLIVSMILCLCTTAFILSLKRGWGFLVASIRMRRAGK